MEEKFRKIQMRTVGLFTILILGVSLYLTVLLSGQADNTLKETAALLIAAHDNQLEMNVDSYLAKVEKAASLLFGSEEYCTYDPGNSSMDPYERQRIVNSMEDRINDLGMLDNYTDFSVVYNNGDSIGWISNQTRSMYPTTGMYDDFADILGSTDHQWVFGLNGNTDHLYYLKRYNDHAIIMVSFYSLELKNYFQIPEQLDGMDAALVDASDHILYSSDLSQIGQTLSDDMIQTLGTITDGTILSRDIIITSNTCDNGWRIVCSIPTEAITRPMQIKNRRSLLGVLVIIALILWFSLRRAKAMNLSAVSIVETLQTQAKNDSMTGLYNKVEFEQEAASCLSSPLEYSFYAFTMIDLDHFKVINDTFGHAAGDAVLITFAKLLRENFQEEEYIVGRLGGDEFGIFAHFAGVDAHEASLRIRVRLQKVRNEFREVDLALGDYKLSFSSGTAFTEPWKANYEQLHKQADDLLYQSKRNGKDRDSSEAGHEET